MSISETRARAEAPKNVGRPQGGLLRPRDLAGLKISPPSATKIASDLTAFLAGLAIDFGVSKLRARVELGLAPRDVRTSREACEPCSGSGTRCRRSRFVGGSNLCAEPWTDICLTGCRHASCRHSEVTFSCASTN
jgi:hypothetical protein